MSREIHRPSWLAGVLTLSVLASGCASGSVRGPATNDDPDSGPSALPSIPARVTESPPASTAAISRSPEPTIAPSAGGGGYAECIWVPPDRLADVSDVAVVARVETVGPTVLNTASGRWDPPDGASAEALHEMFALLAPITPVRLAVLETLGRRPAASMAATVGGTIDLTIVGGTVEFTLSKSDARAIGIGEEAGEKTVPASGDIPVTLSRDAASVARGGTIVAFLRPWAVEYEPGSEPREAIVAIGPQGLFGLFRVDAADPGRVVRASCPRLTATLAELRIGAARLDAMSGPASPPGSLFGSE